MSENDKRPAKTKRVPQRSCIGCGKVRPKRELVRLVLTAEGKLEIDRTGKRAGRGAYVCPDPQCWGVALSKNRLEHCLRTRISAASLEELKKGELLPQSGSATRKEGANDN